MRMRWLRSIVSSSSWTLPRCITGERPACEPHVHLDGYPDRFPPLPAYVEVWRSVRPGGDTKTRRSRRTLALPARCVEALRKQRAQQAADKLAAGDRWHDTGLVFTTAFGSGMDAANVRRDFRRALRFVPGVDPAEWTPRELWHSFVSVLSDAGCPWRSRGWSGMPGRPSRSWSIDTSSSR